MNVTMPIQGPEARQQTGTIVPVIPVRRVRLPAVAGIARELSQAALAAGERMDHAAGDGAPRRRAAIRRPGGGGQPGASLPGGRANARLWDRERHHHARAGGPQLGAGDHGGGGDDRRNRSGRGAVDDGRRRGDRADGRADDGAGPGRGGCTGRADRDVRDEAASARDGLRLHRSRCRAARCTGRVRGGEVPREAETRRWPRN